MPFRETLTIYHRERAAKREQSFRRCLVVLVVFFFLCLVLVLANIPWKKYKVSFSGKEHHNASTYMPQVETTENEVIQETKIRVIIARSTKILSSRTTPNTIASTTENEILLTNQTTTAESTILMNQTEYSKEREERTEETTVTSTNQTTPLQKRTASTAESASMNEIVVNENSSKIPISESRSVEKINSTSTVYEENTETMTPMNEIVVDENSSKTPINESHSVEKINSVYEEDTEIITPIIEQTSKEESNTQNNVIDIDVQNIDDRNSIDTNEELENNILNDTSSTISNLSSDTENSTSTKYDYSQFLNTNTNSTLANDAIIRENETRDNYSVSHNHTLLPDEKFSTSTLSETYTTNATSGTVETTSFNYSTSFDTNFPSTILSGENTNGICDSNYCRQIASKMISYMNDSADPCIDFYEYACGGFEANPLLIDVDQARRFSNYQRIKKQMKEKRENMTFVTYYDNCVKYETTVNFSERIKMARGALNEVGKFYIKDTCSADRANFTDLFAKLILHHSAFLFDVVPEVDEYHPNSFTLKIGPASYERPFKAEYREDLCSENDFETDIYVNFETLYDRYKTCKKQDEKDEIKKSVSDALTILQVFKDLNDNNLELERINEIVNVIDFVIMQGYFSHFPAKSDARKVYLKNDYERISLKELNKEDNSMFINWTYLIEFLTKTEINKDIQVYFLDSMVKGLKKLKEFAEENCTELHNAIMALYARKLYQELVLPKQNAKNHCLQMATYLLRPEATNLYISSFADHEIERMNNRAINMFEELKETLKRNIRNATWAKGKGKQALLDKTDSLGLALPPVSYFKNESLLYNDYNMSQNTLSENHFSDSINLMKRYRTLMYTEMRREFNISVQLWTYYMTPFQSQTKMIYGLNQIVIPYGMIEWATNNEDSLNYISLATFGNIIALQLVHHFDELGIHYWNQTKNTESLMFKDSYTDKNFQNYISEQKENSFGEHIVFPFTNQNVSLTIPQLAVNKQLSQRTGLRLTYDTLDRMRSKVQEEDLPWMKFNIDKLFYLAYAQTYCTKTPLTSSYVALHENEDLPNHILVFVTMFKNPLVDIAWGCQMDQCDPKDTCSVFPDIYVKESASSKLE